MKVNKAIAVYSRLRMQPLWKLLCADNSPMIIALLQTHLLENEQSITSSLLHERVQRDLEALRAQGENFPQTAQAYIADWLSAGYLTRRFPPGAMEEKYELTADAASAIRFINNLITPQSVATESRLTTVIQQLEQLAEETDTNIQSRIANLMGERARINQEITALKAGHMKTLSNEQALERIREIIFLADNLLGDFRHVRDKFDQLNRSFREQIIAEEGSRGEVLSALFAGVDVIAASEAGRTFSAFWRLLTHPEQNATFEASLEQVMTRPFMQQLSNSERRFLSGLIFALLEQGGSVQEVLGHFARNLKHFVQSREYLEQRRLNQLLKEAQQAAIRFKEEVRRVRELDYELTLTSCKFRSFAQWRLYDPSLKIDTMSMQVAQTPAIDLIKLRKLIAESEIDFRSLKLNIYQVLQQLSQASIAEIIQQFPAQQGLGSIIGYLVLANQYAVQGNGEEKVIWQVKDGHTQGAYIPCFYFLRERANELVRTES